MRRQLNGHVVKDEDLWLYSFFDLPAFSPQMVRDALEELPEGEDLILEINSGGGSVYAGFEMYTVLMGSPRHTVAEVQSLAASAASVLMLGCRVHRRGPVRPPEEHRRAGHHHGEHPQRLCDEVRGPDHPG